MVLFNGDLSPTLVYKSLSKKMKMKKKKIKNKKKPENYSLSLLSL